MKRSGICRIQFDLPRKRKPELDMMQKVTGEPTQASLIINALTFFVWAIMEVLADRTIVSYDKKTNTMTRFMIPAFAEAEARRMHTQKDTGGPQ